MSNQRRWISILAFYIVIFALGLTNSLVFGQANLSGQGEVQLGVASFGVGGVARENEWAGVQVQMLDQGSASRDIVLRLSLRDADGDDTQYERIVTANPGMLQSFWLYCRIPFQGASLDYEIKAYEAIDTGNLEIGEFGFRAGRLLGSFMMRPPQIHDSRVALMGIVGNNHIGIDQYGYAVGGLRAMPFGHELIQSVRGLSVDDLPDRWQGLAGLDALIWEGAGTSASSPGRLTPERARAIRAWVERGGHFVVLLPSAGDPWYSGMHPLSSLLPRVHGPTRHEGVDLELYRSMITESDKADLPDNAVVYTFAPNPEAGQLAAVPVLNGPDGQCVVIRRSFGSGMVTVVGLPLNHGQLRRLGFPDAESFWHRVLGLRGDLLRPDQMSEQQKTDVGNRAGLVFDDNIGGEIAKTGRAVQGVFFGAVVFLLYWVVAGPGGFGLLKAKKMKHHAWVFFVASIGVFTTISWVGATTLRPKTTDITHLSLLEQVYGQETQRVRSWMSVMLPSYGSAEISLQAADGAEGLAFEESTNLISPWASSESLSAIAKGFPDNSGYRVESKNPSALRVPTRATVKSFVSDWSGPSRWGMPMPVGEPGSLEEPGLSLSGTVVSGQLVHSLPGVLKDIKVFVLPGQRPILRGGDSLKGQMITRASVFATPLEWEPGQVIELEDLTRTTGIDEQAKRQSNYFTRAVRYGVDTSVLNQGKSRKLTDRLVAGRFISQFEPPRYGVNGDPVGNRLAIRRGLHGWDLGRWFTQPTLILTGVVEIERDQASPEGIPMSIWVNGREVPGSGKTVVTWIYPFEPSPPVFMGSARTGREADSATND